MKEPVGETVFLDWLPRGFFKRAGASLSELSGETIKAPAACKSYVTTAVEAAWETPIARLTCEQVRLLVSQQFGLKWLSRPVAEFVHQYPCAEVIFYPGDLTVVALQAFPQIATHDSDAANLLRATDYGWMQDTFTFDRSLAREAHTLVKGVQQPR